MSSRVKEMDVQRLRQDLMQVTSFKNRVEMSVEWSLKLIRNRSKTTSEVVPELLAEVLFSPASLQYNATKAHTSSAELIVLVGLLCIDSKSSDLRQFYALTFREQLRAKQYYWICRLVSLAIGFRVEFKSNLNALVPLFQAAGPASELLYALLQLLVEDYVDKRVPDADHDPLGELHRVNVDLSQLLLQATVCFYKLQAEGNRLFLRVQQLHAISHWLAEFPSLCLECEPALSNLITWSIGAQLELANSPPAMRLVYQPAFEELHMSILSALYTAPLPNFTLSLANLELAFQLISRSQVVPDEKCLVMDRLMQIVMALRYAKVLRVKRADLSSYIKTLPETELSQIIHDVL